MPNQQLLDYTKQQQAQGVSRETINTNLLSQGWQQTDINEAFSVAENQNTNTPIKKTVDLTNKPNLTKDYLNLAIRLNVSIIIAKYIAVFIMGLTTMGYDEESAIDSIIVELILLIGLTTATFFGGFWIFKMIYGDMLKKGKQIKMIYSVLFSVILFIIIDITLYLLNNFFSSPEKVFIYAIIESILASVAFYLAGKSVEKKNQQGKIAQSNK